MKHYLKQKAPFLYESNNKGYIALISVLIISAISLLIASSANLFSIGEANMGLEENQAWAAYYLANLCSEDALMKLKNDLDYGGSETLNFNEGTCVIEPLEGAGEFNRTIKVIGMAYNQTRKIKIEINRVNPVMEIKSWRQVAEF